MYFANPLGLLGLIAVPVILFIHLFQRRFPPLEVGGLHLWLSEDTVKTSGQRRDRIPVTRTLILELIAAILLSLLLAQPQWSNLNRVKHWVFVLDDSASMLGVDGQGISFRDRAIDEMQKRVATSGRNSRLSVILSGTRPVMLVGPAARWPDAEPVLQSWQPNNTRHQFHSAWEMASQLAEASGELVFLTDDVRVNNKPKDLEVVSVGMSLGNIAFETARWSINPETLSGNLYLRIRNCSDLAISGELIGMARGQEVLRRPLSLSARAVLPLSMELPGGLGRLDLSIQANDDRLETDSRLALMEPLSRDVKVAFEIPDDHPATRPLMHVLKMLPSVQVVADPAVADLRITNFAEKSTAVTQTPRQWEFALGTVTATDDGPNNPPPLPGEATEIKETSEAEISNDKPDELRATVGPFLIDRRSTLMEGVSLQGIIWSMKPCPKIPVLPLVTVDNLVLIGERTDTPGRSFFVNVDMAGSNLNDSQDWPVLISNLVEACRDSRPGLRRWNYQLNEIVRFEADPSKVDFDKEEPLTLKRGAETRTLVRSRSIEVPPVTEAGVYQVLDGEQLLGEFAVNFFDADESDLSKLDSGTIPRSSESASAMLEDASVPWVWMALLVLIAAVAVFNWAGLRPPANRTVRAGGIT